MKKRSICCLAMATAVLCTGMTPSTKVMAQEPVSVINWNQTYQQIDGFGFTQEEECTYNMEELYRSEVMDVLF